MKYDSILWIGTIAEGEYLRKLQVDNTYIQNAANRVQEYFLSGLSENFLENIDVISGLATNAYPSTRRWRIIKREDRLNHGGRLINVGFLNFPYINCLFQQRNLVKEARIWAKKNRKKSVIVIVYAMRTPYYAAATAVKKIIPNAKIVNIVPDLPQYMKEKRSWFESQLVKFNQYLMNKYRRIIDGYVLYAEPMAKKLDIKEKTYVVIEGLFEEQVTNSARSKRENKKKVCVYAGGLEKRYGLDMLVEGFLAANIPDIELHIYGNGSYLDKIKKITDIAENNVFYKGVVTSSEAFDIMKDADLLINPRYSDADFTKYSCPSKTFEYMASGTPVLMTRLEGIPDEYYDYVFTIENETAQGLASDLKFIFSLSENARVEVGRKARKFILSEKNSVAQVKKMINFIEKLE